MERRTFALAVLEADTLEGKLAPPAGALTDAQPGPPLRRSGPGRPPGLEAVAHAQAKVPPPAGMHDPAQRARILHALANHELQAAELFAWALLAFPDTPEAFRRGLLKVLVDEQRHCALYLERLAAHGARFGAWPLSSHFWRRIDAIETPLQFVCTMGLTFENANLDFCREHIDAARAAGDDATAAVLEQVHADEIGHVRFAWRWLNAWKEPGESAWAAYVRSVAPPHGPARARGAELDVEARRAAGLEAAFIEALAATPPTRPGGAPR